MFFENPVGCSWVCQLSDIPAKSKEGILGERRQEMDRDGPEPDEGNSCIKLISIENSGNISRQTFVRN